jgi:hypothetical protein
MSRVDVERMRRNEETFAFANEQILEAATLHGVEPVPFVCECAAARCTELIPIPADEYRQVRDQRGFLLKPGHDDPDVEHVVAERDGYVVVEKFR